jgi:hypothetical protein
MYFFFRGKAENFFALLFIWIVFEMAFSYLDKVEVETIYQITNLHNNFRNGKCMSIDFRKLRSEKYLEIHWVVKEKLR